MVIIVSKEGQLANRIWHASFFLVNAQEYKYKLKHFFFDDYYSYFSESLDRHITPIRFWGKKKTWLVEVIQNMMIKIVSGFIKLGITRLPFFEIIKYGGYDQDAISFDLNDQNFLKKAKSKLVLIHGWLFQDVLNKKKYRELLLDTWRPNEIFQKNIDSYYKKYIKEHDIIVGVHIRGGDYKKFEKGKWYYTTEQYYEKIKEVSSLNIFKEKKLAFIICTNEKNISFPGAQSFSIFIEERHFVEDLYLLAKCNYIIGPPSTFSIWSSFYGGVPLYMIKDAGIEITDEVFKINSTVF